MKSLKRIGHKIMLRAYTKKSIYYCRKSLCLMLLAMHMYVDRWPSTMINRILDMARAAHKEENKWNHYANAELEELMILES